MAICDLGLSLGLGFPGSRHPGSQWLTRWLEPTGQPAPRRCDNALPKSTRRGVTLVNDFTKRALPRGFRMVNGLEDAAGTRLAPLRAAKKTRNIKGFGLTCCRSPQTETSSAGIRLGGTGSRILSIDPSRRSKASWPGAHPCMRGKTKRDRFTRLSLRYHPPRCPRTRPSLEALSRARPVTRARARCSCYFFELPGRRI